MQLDIEISPAEIADAEEILMLQKLAFTTEAALYGDWSIPALKKTLADIESEFLHKTFLKATLGESIVGSVRGELLNDGTCAIGGLIVHPDCRRNGIGSRLMLAIEKIFPRAERFELFTGQRSEGNILLYTRLGYVTFRKESLSPKVGLVFMEKMRSNTK